MRLSPPGWRRIFLHCEKCGEAGTISKVHKISVSDFAVSAQRPARRAEGRMPQPIPASFTNFNTKKDLCACYGRF